MLDDRIHCGCAGSTTMDRAVRLSVLFVAIPLSLIPNGVDRRFNARNVPKTLGGSTTT